KYKKREQKDSRKINEKCNRICVHLFFRPYMWGNHKGIRRICEGKFPGYDTHDRYSWEHSICMCSCSKGRAGGDCQKCPDICACCDRFIYIRSAIIISGAKSCQHASRF